MTSSFVGLKEKKNLGSICKRWRNWRKRHTCIEVKSNLDEMFIHWRIMEDMRRLCVDWQEIYLHLRLQRSTEGGKEALSQMYCGDQGMRIENGKSLSICWHRLKAKPHHSLLFRQTFESVWPMRYEEISAIRRLMIINMFGVEGPLLQYKWKNIENSKKIKTTPCILASGLNTHCKSSYNCSKYCLFRMLDHLQRLCLF